ncbi:hypothetical protein RRG08_045356 [Elysia crispata]|uniref:Uncharacterized protein n=1 Tax=Elysia crispata TaxID=231223 RepID=A0AAE1CVC7_9GAST|nr:hypothetical protein RRG08_045356 [Elysia crispata]
MARSSRRQLMKKEVLVSLRVRLWQLTKMTRLTTRGIPHRAQQTNSNTVSHTNKELIERARATLKKKKQPSTFLKREVKGELDTDLQSHAAKDL